MEDKVVGVKYGQSAFHEILKILKENHRDSILAVAEMKKVATAYEMKYPCHTILCKNEKKAEEVAQRLRALGALSENLSLVPRARQDAHNHI